MHFYSVLPSPREALTIRPANLAEFRFCKAFGWKQAGNSHANVDAIGAHCTRRGRGGLFKSAMGRSRAGAANRADAVDFLLQRIRDNPGELTLMVVAPLTNIGAAIDRDLATFRKLKRVVIMGRIGRSRL